MNDTPEGVKYSLNDVAESVRLCERYMKERPEEWDHVMRLIGYQKTRPAPKSGSEPAWKDKVLREPSILTVEDKLPEKIEVVEAAKKVMSEHSDFIKELLDSYDSKSGTVELISDALTNALYSVEGDMKEAQERRDGEYLEVVQRRWSLIKQAQQALAPLLGDRGCPHQYFENMGKPNQRLACDLQVGTPRVVKEPDWPKELNCTFHDEFDDTCNNCREVKARNRTIVLCKQAWSDASAAKELPSRDKISEAMVGIDNHFDLYLQNRGCEMGKQFRDAMADAILKELKEGA